MSSHLIAALHQEERAIIAELRASRPFMRLEGIRRLLEMYDAQPSVSVGLEMAPPPAADRATASVVQIAPPMAAAPQAIPMPGPVAAMAEAAVAEAARTAPPMAVAAPEEPASVVSSVRAALLGIGKP
ncbi:hypothetical protein GXW74_00505 [Roseomonas eburnea]|uniref:Uncharacterized protein n=1 Tax=Neoroseomonas eburnea TaxID=1346889 RepID=A0A9X9X5H0_9PROT|nr:hypothetical protein [Neoroseomonas eburnea]MBR0678956.1 hypothetical protein [Neoroseomonas eburnea]